MEPLESLEPLEPLDPLEILASLEPVEPLEHLESLEPLESPEQLYQRIEVINTKQTRWHTVSAGSPSEYGDGVGRHSACITPGRQPASLRCISGHFIAYFDSAESKRSTFARLHTVQFRPRN